MTYSTYKSEKHCCNILARSAIMPARDLASISSPTAPANPLDIRLDGGMNHENRANS